MHLLYEVKCVFLFYPFLPWDKMGSVEKRWGIYGSVEDKWGILSLDPLNSWMLFV